MVDNICVKDVTRNTATNLRKHETRLTTLIESIQNKTKSAAHFNEVLGQLEVTANVGSDTGEAMSEG